MALMSAFAVWSLLSDRGRLSWPRDAVRVLVALVALPFAVLDLADIAGRQP